MLATGLDFLTSQKTHVMMKLFFIPRAYKCTLRFFSVSTQKMIVTPWVLALCVGVSLSQEVTANKDALEMDGKDGAGTSSVEYVLNYNIFCLVFKSCRSLILHCLILKQIEFDISFIKTSWPHNDF